MWLNMEKTANGNVFFYDICQYGDAFFMKRINKWIY